MLVRDRKPPLTCPSDFDSFWRATWEELQQTPLELSFRHTPAHTPQLRWFSCRSLNDATIQGYLLSWNDNRQRPLVVHSHGYNDQVRPNRHCFERGMHVCGIDIRGFGRSAEALRRAPEGYMLSGIDSKHSYVLRGAVCDYARAIDVAEAAIGDRIGRTVLEGTSFAGGLAIMAEAQAQRADLLVVAVPTFGWHAGRRRLVKYGSGAEINAFISARPELERATMDTLCYFDSMNFAPKIRCPVLVGVGLRDDVVPAPTVFAIANHFTAPRLIREFPVSHSDEPEEKLWERFVDEWLELATQDLGRPIQLPQHD